MRQSTELLNKINIDLPEINLDAKNIWWVGFSGGLDSTVLLHLLLSKNLPVTISAIHINHQISPNAHAWQKHCETFCQLRGIQCVSEKVRVENKGRGVEEAARSVRYEVFAKYLAAGDALFTAHHADDQAETMLLRLLRGTGVKGLSGIATERSFGTAIIYRPLLSFTRSDLLDYAKQQGLEWIEDESNLLDKYDRNYLRLHVMPLLQQHWPGLPKKWNQTAQLFAETETLLTEMAVADLQTIDLRDERIGQSISRKYFSGLSIPRQHNLLRYWLSIQGYSIPEQQHWQQIRLQIFSEKTDSSINLQWGNVSLRVYQDRVFALPLLLPELKLTMVECIADTSAKFLRADLPDIHIKNRQGGERCRPVGRNHSQTLKKCLQEFGLEPWLRDLIPLIYSGENLVAVGDLWVCAEYVAEENVRGLKLDWRI